MSFRRSLVIVSALLGCDRSSPKAPVVAAVASIDAAPSVVPSASVVTSSTASASASISPAPVSSIDLDPSIFGGVDVCLRDTEGTANTCGQTFGLHRTPGAPPERWCQLEPAARAALIEARAAMQKANPDLELLVISSYRPPGYQQCLWLDEGAAPTKPGKKPKCLASVCGPRDAAGKSLPCKKYDLDDPKYAHAFDHCAHVDMRAIDVCAYSRSKVTLDARGVLDMKLVEDCRLAADPKHVLEPGHFYHPCGCRHVGWTKDIREATKKTKLFPAGSVGDQQAMMRALREAGLVDDVSNEWWHFDLHAK